MTVTKRQDPQSSSKTTVSSTAVGVALNFTIILLWFWLYRPLLDYFTLIFTREDFRTNQIILVAGLLLIFFQLKKENARPNLSELPRFEHWPLALAVGCSVLFLLAERFIAINTLSATLFGLATYGLLGLWLSPRRWRSGLPAALLLVGVLPFGAHLQTFVGYPMRIVTAALVRDGLAAAGVASVGIDTILVFENGVSQVDLPCSGVKSLWTGMLFLLAASWIEKRPLNGRWLLVAFALVALLFLANLARVAVLIMVGQVLGWQLVAEMLHVPLGVLGFAAVCAAAVLLLRQTGVSGKNAPSRQSTKSRWPAPALIIFLAVMIGLYAERPSTVLAEEQQAIKMPEGVVIEPMPLKPDELAWLTADGASAVERHRFSSAGVSGSLILITSSTWRAHHRPERCFEVYGLSLEESSTQLAAGSSPIRYVSLGDGERHSLQTAVYWFQSPTRTTDDYATRIWADLPPEREQWVLVSILFDKALAADDPTLQRVAAQLHQAVGARWIETG